MHRVASAERKARLQARERLAHWRAYPPQDETEAGLLVAETHGLAYTGILRDDFEVATAAEGLRDRALAAWPAVAARWAVVHTDATADAEGSAIASRQGLGG